MFLLLLMTESPIKFANKVKPAKKLAVQDKTIKLNKVKHTKYKKEKQLEGAFNPNLKIR